MHHTFRTLFCAFLALTWPAAASFGHSQAPSSQQSTPAGQSSSQNSPLQAPSQTQRAKQDKQDAVAEAASKAKDKKGPASKLNVFTEDALTVMTGSVSVVDTEHT